MGRGTFFPPFLFGGVGAKENPPGEQLGGC